MAHWHYPICTLLIQVSKEEYSIRIRNFEYSNVFPLFDSKIRSYIYEYRSNIFLHVLRRKIRPGRYLTLWLYYEKDYNTLGCKVKPLNLLKQINFTKQTHIKLAVSSPSVAATRSLP